MARITIPKARASLFLRRGVIGPREVRAIEAGRKVEVDIRGGGTSTQVQATYIDGRQVGGVQPVTKPEGPRRVPRAREQQLTPGVTIPQPSRVPSISEQERPATPRGGLPARGGITAADIFGVARSKGRAAEEIVGTGPVFSREETAEETIFTPVGGRGAGFAPSKERQGAARRQLERDLGAFGFQEDIRPLREKFREKPISIKDVVKTVGVSFVAPTRKRAEASHEALTKFEAERLSPGISRFLGTEKGIRQREIIEKNLPDIVARDTKERKFSVVGGKERFTRDVLSIGIGGRMLLAKPVTEVAPEVALGIATGGAFRGAGLLLERAPLPVIKALASPAGQVIRKGARTGAFATFAGLEAKTISKANRPFERLGQTPLRLAAFGAGEALSAKALTGGVRRKVGTPFAELERQELIQSRLTKGGQKFIDELIVTQRAARGAPEPIPKEFTAGRLPKAIGPKPVRQKIAKLILKEKPVIFGSATTPEIRAAKDLDLALKNVLKAEAFRGKAAKITGAQIRGQAVGKPDAKGFDVKEFARLEEFGFIEPLRKTPKGVPVTRQSEQLARKIGGVIEGRSKDVEDAIKLARLLRQRQTKSVVKGISERGVRIKEVPQIAGDENILGRALKKDKVILLKKGLPRDLKLKVLRHEEFHIKHPLAPELAVRVATGTTQFQLGKQFARIKSPKKLFKPGVKFEPVKPGKLSSLLPSKLPSRAPSLLPSRLSKVPSAIKPSRVPRPTRIPTSKTPASRISSILKSSKQPSRLPTSKIPSILKPSPPSKLPTSKIPSILKPSPPSKLPVSRIPTSRVPSRLPPPTITRLPPPRLSSSFGKEQRRLQEREIKRVFKYTPTVEAVDKKIKGKRPRRLTGLDVRPIPL